MVECVHSLMQYDKKVISAEHALRKALKLEKKDKRELLFYEVPEGGVGLHISVGKNAEGQRVDFEVEYLFDVDGGNDDGVMARVVFGF